MDTPIKHLGAVIIAIIAVLLCVGLVRTVVSDAGEKIDSSMESLTEIDVNDDVNGGGN